MPGGAGLEREVERGILVKVGKGYKAEMEEVTIGEAMLEAARAYEWGRSGGGTAVLSLEALYVLMEAAAPDLPAAEEKARDA